MALQVARGMAYLHQLSPPVIHFDLKPDNLLINREGGRLNVKVRAVLLPELALTLVKTHKSLVVESIGLCHPIERSPLLLLLCSLLACQAASAPVTLESEVFS